VLKTQAVAKGKNAQAPANPKRTGYKFAGWSRAFSNVQGPITVAAKWTPEKYKITWKLYKGKLKAKSMPKSYIFGKGLKLKKPKRAGYKFKGWYTSKKMLKKLKSISKKRTGRIKLFARWSKIR